MLAGVAGWELRPDERTRGPGSTVAGINWGPYVATGDPWNKLSSLLGTFQDLWEGGWDAQPTVWDSQGWYVLKDCFFPKGISSRNRISPQKQKCPGCAIWRDTVPHVLVQQLGCYMCCYIWGWLLSVLLELRLANCATVWGRCWYQLPTSRTSLH